MSKCQNMKYEMKITLLKEVPCPALPWALCTPVLHSVPESNGMPFDIFFNKHENNNCESLTYNTHCYYIY